MRFKQWFLAEDSKKKVLVLIHPDCIIELGAKQTNRYINLVKTHLPQFDYVITHLFFTDGKQWSDSWTPEMVQAHRNLFDTVKSLSDAAIKRGGYDCSYSQELPDYLMENPHSDIYMAGGYENNCLWISYKMLFEKLAWLLKEQKHNVSYYKPLIFAHHGYGGLDRNKEYEKPMWINDFHPKKVQYSNDLKDDLPPTPLHQTHV